jgi:YbbR domain-containing protein
MQWWKTNSGLKVVALLLAIATWFFVKAITSERRVVEDIPLDIKVKPGLVVLESGERYVSVTLRGTHTDIWQVSRPELSAELDLHHAEQAGEVRVALEPRLIRHPPRVQVVQVMPAYVTVRLGLAASANKGNLTP